MTPPANQAEAHYRCHSSVQAIQRLLCEYERALDHNGCSPLTDTSPTQRLEDASTRLLAEVAKLQSRTTDFIAY